MKLQFLEYQIKSRFLENFVSFLTTRFFYSLQNRIYLFFQSFWKNIRVNCLIVCGFRLLLATLVLDLIISITEALG